MDVSVNIVAVLNFKTRHKPSFLNPFDIVCLQWAVSHWRSRLEQHLFTRLILSFFSGMPFVFSSLLCSLLPEWRSFVLICSLDA